MTTYIEGRNNLELEARLSSGEVVLMDGGVSTAMEQKGLSMDHSVWSGTAHMSQPDLVRDVHGDYIRAGAEIITSNTFATAPHVLHSKGYGPDEADEINRRAVEVACQARVSAGVQDVWIAGSMSSMPSLTEITTTATGPRIADSYRRQAHALARAGADLILAEMMLDIENAALVLEAANEVGLPIWIGFSAGISDDGHATSYRGTVDFNAMPIGDFGVIVEAALAYGGQAAGIMHSEMRATGPALDVLRNRWTGPTFAYAETGRFLNPDWDFTDAASPAHYASVAEAWVKDHGATIIGGCCGTGPAHIQALKDRLLTDA